MAEYWLVRYPGEKRGFRVYEGSELKYHLSRGAEYKEPGEKWKVKKKKTVSKKTVKKR